MHQQRWHWLKKKKISGVSDFINGSVTATHRIPQCKCCVLPCVPHLRRTLTTKYVSIQRKGPGWWGVQNPTPHREYLKELGVFSWRRTFGESDSCPSEVEALSRRRNELPSVTMLKWFLAKQNSLPLIFLKKIPDPGAYAIVGSSF